jgi:hypothetical protein
MTIKTPKARHQRFLAAGFFPQEMPSCFYSETFAPHSGDLFTLFSEFPKKNKNPDYYSFKSEKVSFNFPRFKREDRRHSYINPISFFFLAKVLAENYVNLRKLNRQSHLSVAPSIFDWSGPRSLIGPVFEPRNAQNSSLNARFEVLAEADISGFYHSVYTHTIAWAIHGRNISKKNRNDLTLYGNIIDLLVRNAQDGQTIGIPVGPDTSRLIAEVIGSAIDRTIQKSLKVMNGNTPDTRSAMRFVDDYTFGCESQQAAEKTIAVVRLAVNHYELDLNNSKTGIRTSTPFAGVAWREHLRSFLPGAGACDAAALNRYFYNVHIVAQGNLTNDVIKYAIKAATKAFLETDDWSTVQDYLLSAYRQSATVLSSMVEMLIFRQMIRRDVSVKVITDFVNSRIQTLADLQKNGEIMWLLFLAICLHLKLRPNTVKRLSQVEDGAIAVLVTDANRLGLVEGVIKFDCWDASLTPDGLRSKMWLYSYESALKGLNGNSINYHVMHDKYFKELYKRKIEFYRSGNCHINSNKILRTMKIKNMRKKLREEKLKDNYGIEIDDFDTEDFSMEFSCNEGEDDDIGDIYI